MSRFLSAEPIVSFRSAAAIVRIICGLFMVYHGWEVFSTEPIDTYTGWLTDKHFPEPRLWAYMGKGVELVGGLLLVFGIFTKLSSLVLMLDMLFITFVIGHGKIWYEDQHPFMFVLFFAFFLVCGPGKWSVDARLFPGK